MPEYDPQDEQQANQDLLERFNEQIQPDEGEPEAPPPQDDDEPELSVDEAPDDGEGDGEGGKKTRKEKKRDRFKQLQEERDEERKRAEELEKRLASIEQRAAAYPDPNTLQQHLLQRGQPQQQEDPTDSELQDVYSQQEQLFQYANAQWNNLDRADREKIQKRARDLDEKKAELLYQKAAKKHQPRQPDEREVMRRTVQAQIQHEHSDVYQNPAAVQYATGEYARLRHQGYSDSWDTLKQAMDSARGAFGMKRRQTVQPTEAQRRRLAGMPKGGGEGGGAKRRTIKMTQDYKDMADAAFPNIEDDAKRYQHWANTVGKNLVGGE